MKKILSGILTIILTLGVFALTACGAAEPGGPSFFERYEVYVGIAVLVLFFIAVFFLEGYRRRRRRAARAYARKHKLRTLVIGLVVIAVIIGGILLAVLLTGS